MSTVVLIQAQPRFASTGAVADIRLAGGGTKAYFQLGYGDWRSGVARPPRFSTAVGFDQRGLTGGALPSTGAFEFGSSDKSLFSALGNVIWDGARVIVTTGDDEALAPVYAPQLVGTVAAIRTDGAKITFTIADLSIDLDKPVIPDTFAGTGDLEGGDDATGRPKRRSWGRVFNVEGMLLDKAQNIYEFGDPTRPIQSFDLVKDKGRPGDTVAVPWQGSALATLAALRATTPPSGGAAVAPSIACVKWWTVPAGPLTADLSGEVGAGYVGAAIGIAGRLALTYSPTITIDPASRATAETWPSGIAPAGVHCAETSETVGNLLDRLLLPLSIIWILDGAGRLIFRRLTWTGPVEALQADTIKREVTFKPLKTRKVGFQRNYRQHSDSEIAATILNAADVTYADGTPIEVLKPLEAGANVTESRTAAAIAGQGAFATVSSADYGSPLLTGFGALAPLGSISFGTPYLLEQAGGAQAILDAFKTSLGQAASIFGQGLFATVNSAGYGSPLLTGFAALAALDRIILGTSGPGGIVDAANSRWLGNADLITLLGTAASFTGQGSLATLSSLANGSPYLTGFGALSAFTGIKSQAPQDGPQDYAAIITGQGDFVTDVLYRTPFGTAAAITGQTVFATLASGTSLDNPVFGMPGRIAGHPEHGPTYLAATAIAFSVASGSNTLQNLRPAEYGSNVTEGRTAAAINGQASWATYTGLVPSNVAGQVQKLQTDGNATTSMIYQPGVAFLSDRFPGEAGANVTENRSAASIAGQGAFATVNSAGYGSPLLTGFNVLATLSSVSLNSTRITRADGTTSVSETLVVTNLGVAASISGQGTLATQNAVSGTQVVNGIIRSANNSTVIDLDNGRIILRSNGRMKAMGAAFGSANQFTEWSGPDRATLDQCTEAEAIAYETVQGGAYFNGSVGEAQLRATKTNTALGVQQIAIGPQATNGKNRYWVAGLAISRTGTRTSRYAPLGDWTGSFVIEQLNAQGAWVQVGPNGTLSGYTYDDGGTGGNASPSESGSFEQSASGIIQYVDSSGGTEPFQIRARITALSTPGVSGSAPVADRTIQNLTITSYEP